MIGKIFAAAAFALLAPSLALAQTGGMMASGYQMTATDALASKLIGSPIYSSQMLNNGQAGTPAATTSNNAANATAANGNSATATNANGTATATANASGTPQTAGDTNAQQIGTIRDLVTSKDGRVSAVVIGIGGVLGLGEKNVAVAYNDVQWTIAADGSVRGMLDTTADALKAAPDFQWPSNGQATKAGENNANAAAANANANNANANANANTNAANANASANANAMTPAPAASNATPAAPAATMAPAAPAASTAPAGQNMAVPTDPQGFANMAAPANLFEIQSSQLALKQGQADNVKQFAQKMIDDHTKADQDMAAAAKSENVTVPTALDDKGQQQMQQLQGLKGADFDKAYVQMQVAAHDDAVNLFQGYSQNGKAGALKDFAAKTLPVLQMHQQMIHQIAGK